MVVVGVVGSPMSVVPIVANVLALMPCVPLMVAVVGSVMSVAPSMRTPLPLPLLELSEGKESTTRESQRPCLVGSLSRKRPRMPKGVAVALMVVIVVL